MVRGRDALALGRRRSYETSGLDPHASGMAAHFRVPHDESGSLAVRIWHAAPRIDAADLGRSRFWPRHIAVASPVSPPVCCAQIEGRRVSDAQATCLLTREDEPVDLMSKLPRKPPKDHQLVRIFLRHRNR